jgi:hypothetical protein
MLRPVGLVVKQEKEFMPIENSPQQVELLDVSIANMGNVFEELCEYRAKNSPVILSLKPAENTPLDEAIEVAIQLRDWDQLTLQNILALFGNKFSPEALSVLQKESRIEQKCFTEWLMASHDSRINKYPQLPYRSFIRKIIKENFSFILNCLQIWDSENSGEEMKKVLRDFIETKKKVVTIFPKKWERLQ